MHIKASFNVAENGGGSYRLLAILRWVMVVVFVSFGMQKFTLQSAQGIVQSSAIVHLFRGYRYSVSGVKRISSALPSLPLRRCLRPVLSAQSCQPSVR